MKHGALYVENRDGIAVLYLDRGVINALSPGMVAHLTRTLDELEEDETVKAVVLTSSNPKFFSIGLDVPNLIQLSEPGFSEFYHDFNELTMRLYSFPKPLVAGVTGHAMGGGCILALVCDYRYISSGKRFFGLPEIKLGLPVPYPADTILRTLVGSLNAREVIDSGEGYSPDDALKLGLVDRILAPKEVLPRSMEKARELASHPGKAFWLVKKNRTEETLEAIGRQRAKKEDFFVRAWFSSGVQEELKELVKKF